MLSRLFIKPVAFIKKDVLMQVSYKLDFMLSLLGVFVSVATFYFISRVFGKGTAFYLKDYGGQYFPFVLIGIAFNNYLSTSLMTFSSKLRQEQVMGTLEAMLVTPTKVSTVIISLSLWNFIFSSISVILYLLFGILFFGVNFKGANFIGAAVILFLTMICFSSIGIISASFIMIFKRGDPVTWLISKFSALFGGVYFPITVLPKGLQTISYFLPVTYSLRALRHTLLQGYPLGLLGYDISILMFFSVFLLPLSVFIFKYAVKTAKMNGSLLHY